MKICQRPSWRERDEGAAVNLEEGRANVTIVQNQIPKNQENLIDSRDPSLYGPWMIAKRNLFLKQWLVERKQLRKVSLMGRA